jgi:surfactin synthase thioesterase subunit
MKLFCLPHAGGSARRIAAALGPYLDGAEPVPLELPGRGERWREPAYLDWTRATRDLAWRLQNTLDDVHYGLYGHSLGALLAYELTHHLHQQRGLHELPPPALLVVSGRNPPHLRPEVAMPHTSGTSDEELFATLVRLGGISASAAGPLTYRAFLPALRDDLRLARRYSPDPDRPPLPVPLLVMYGRDDPLTSPAAASGWCRYSSIGCTVREFPGDHFFPLHHPADVGAVVGPQLAAAVPPVPSPTGGARDSSA